MNATTPSTSSAARRLGKRVARPVLSHIDERIERRLAPILERLDALERRLDELDPDAVGELIDTLPEIRSGAEAIGRRDRDVLRRLVRIERALGTDEA